MALKFVCCTVAVILLSLAQFEGANAITCSRPAEGEDVVGVDGRECVALIKEKCSGMRSVATTKWKRGLNVKQNCNTIPTNTAIATFEGPNNSYPNGGRQHAAIFVSCAADGLVVYDQWNSSNGAHRRTLRYGNTNNSPSNDGNKFYTIQL